MGEEVERNSEPDYGFQLAQLQKMLQAHHLKVKMRVVGGMYPDDFVREEIIENLKHRFDYVIVNYYRPVLGQKGGGHISPPSSKP